LVFFLLFLVFFLLSRRQTIVLRGLERRGVVVEGARWGKGRRDRRGEEEHDCWDNFFPRWMLAEYSWT
jgi:hypothetical protein